MLITKEKKENNKKEIDSEINLENSDNINNENNIKEEKEEKKEINDFEIIDNDDENDKIRTYDVSVTYDLYYCVPRMWLVGYYSKGRLLTVNEMKEDVMPEYRNKTVTIEPHPCTGIKNISVHPCRHSLLLKKND